MYLSRIQPSIWLYELIQLFVHFASFVRLLYLEVVSINARDLKQLLRPKIRQCVLSIPFVADCSLQQAHSQQLTEAPR